MVVVVEVAEVAVVVHGTTARLLCYRTRDAVSPWKLVPEPSSTVHTEDLACWGFFSLKEEVKDLAALLAWGWLGFSGS